MKNVPLCPQFVGITNRYIKNFPEQLVSYEMLDSEMTSWCIVLVFGILYDAIKG